GKFIFTIPGIKTLPIAIAKPTSKAPVNKSPIPLAERINIPKTNRPSDKAIVVSMPRRLASLGAKGDRRANAIRGKVVILPARALQIPKSYLINDTKAPAEVKGARKFDATRITPITKK